MNFLVKHKTASIVIGVIVFFLLTVGTILYLSGKNITSAGGNKTLAENDNMSSSSSHNQGHTKNANFNPLINNDELNRVQKAYNKSGTPHPKYNFNYHLSPQLMDKKTSMLI